MHDAIVIGSGAGGLGAAAALGGRGIRALVLEAMPDAGGYLNPFTRKGYRFDAGMHYVGQVGEDGVFRALLERLGAWDHVRFREIDPDGFLRFHCGEIEFALPAGRDAIAARLAERFPGEVRAIERFLRTIVQIDAAVEAAAQMGAGPGPWLGALPHLPRLLGVMNRTYAELLESHTGDAGLRAVLAMMNCGLPAREASALIPALMFRHYLGGAFYPEGGSGALRDALLTSIGQSGGEVRTRTLVERIRRIDGGFRLEGEEEEWRCRCVVVNADPTLLYTKLLDAGRQRRKAEACIPSVAAFYAYVATGLDLESLGMSSASIQHFDSLEAMQRNGYSAEHGFESFLVSSTTLKDPQGGHAPAGEHIVEIVAPAPLEPFERWAHLPSMKRGREYRAFKEELGWQLVRKAERYVPGLEKSVRYVDFATPVTNLYWVNAPAGGCYGPAHLPSQVGPRRFSSKGPLPGLFLCGAGTLAGGIYPCMRSGEIAAQLAARYLG